MGVFTLLADTSSYTFTITEPSGIDSVYQLPMAKKQGFVLSYLSQDEAKVILAVKQNYATAQDCKLWISYCDSLWAVHDCEINDECQLPLYKENLPSGIVTFTLSDANGEPQAERLVYVQKEDPDVLLSLDKYAFSAKEKVDVNIKLETPHLANLSFAVVDSLLSNSPKLQTTSIKAYAQLGSELKGYIPHINQYLGRDRSTVNKRDLLLMTHGWRRFEWIDNRESLSTMKVHDFNRVYGQVKRMGKPYPKAKIGAYMLGESIAFSEFTSDDQGRFFLDPNYQMRAYKDMVITARNKKGRSGVTLSIQNTDTILFSAILRNNEEILEPYYSSCSILKENEKPQVINEPFMLHDTQLLQEFEVSADRRTWDMDRYLRATSEVKVGQDIEEFISFDRLLTQVSNKIRLEGEQYSGPYLGSQDLDYFGEKLQLRASSDRAIVETSPYDRQNLNLSPPMELGPIIQAQLSRTVNGVYWSNLHEELKIIFTEDNPPSAMIYVNEKPWGYDLSSMNLLVKEDINAIAVLDGALAYERFGIDAYYGAIMLDLKPDAISKIRMKSSNATFGNFVKARQFAKPIYETEEQIKTAGDDNRITLHWEPLLETDENGKAEVSFYTGDIPGKKQIVVQGFDDEGNLYYETGSFVVRDVMER